MAPLGYIEVLDAKGRVTARFAVDVWPVTIGRAYTNRVILEDPFVSPEHLSIGRDESDRLCANDLNSENGLRDAPGGQRVAVLPLVSGRPFQIGHTVLRYSELQQRVAATAVEGGERRPRVPSWSLGLASLVILLVVLLLENYFDSYERFYVARSLSETLTTLSMVFAWAGMWSLLSRVVIGRFHYAEHFALAGGAILVALLFNISAEWLEFFRPSAVVIGTGAIADYAARNTFNTAMEYSGVIKAVDSRWLPTVSIDQFIANSQKVKRELEALAQKTKPAQP